MKSRLTPASMVTGLVLAVLLAAVILLNLATQRPWLGVALGVDEAGIIRVLPESSAFPQPSEGLWRVVNLRGDDRRTITIEAGDLVEEPDTLPAYAAMNHFFERQSSLDELLRGRSVTVRVINDAGEKLNFAISPRPQRPISDLPAAFWVQLFVGLSSFLIGGWVWSLRRHDPATGLFALASFGILGFTFPAALYSTREFAIDGMLFHALSIMNHGGALLFGAAMIALLLRYPRPLVPARWLWAPFLVFGAWWLGDSLQLFDGPPTGSHLPTMVEMIGILLAAALQYWRARGDPGSCAVVRWFGLSVAMGAGAFVLMVIAPNLVGLTPSLPQGYAFSFFLLIHAGMAIGVARYRLFDLDRWAFHILFYMTGVALLVAVDALLISWIAIERAPAFGLALVLVAFLYLPLRDTIQRKLLRRGSEREAGIHEMIAIALAHTEDDRLHRWRDLLNRIFQPLRIVPGDATTMPALLDEGAALAIPATGSLPPQRLEYAMRGRRLFSSREQAKASELCAMLSHAIDSRVAHEQGASEERQRITSDMHDNIGVQLLGALHSPDPIRKDELIRDTLTDLREIINNSAGGRLTLAEVMADLRVEIADLLSSAGLSLVWQVDADADLPPQSIAAMRSILREAVGNALRHAGAANIGVRLSAAAGHLVLLVADDGEGFEPETVRPGNGLRNMRSRATALQGTMTVSRGAAMGARGTVIEVRFPLEGVAA